MADPLDALPPAGGSYVLVLHSPAAARLTIGRLGEVTVTPGWYLYVGSALGAGGLRGRLRHHRQPVRRPHWHIDYLRQFCTIEQIWWVVDRERWEHRWAHALAELPLPSPFPRFGASDCRCVAHCFFAGLPPQLAAFEDRMHMLYPNLPPMNCTVLR